jgi:hypothetical protein
VSFTSPFHFTHQNASWAESAAEKARYPDENVAEVEGLPDANDANQPLIDLFRQKLALSPADASVAAR